MSLSIARFGLGFVLATLAGGCLVSSESDPIDADAITEGSEAALTAVSNFGPNPGALKMYTYSPVGVGDNAPVVVALHGCTQTAQEYVKAGWNNLADQWKFHVIYPEQQTANSSFKCFNWYELGDMKRGAGEALSIAQMVSRFDKSSIVSSPNGST